MTIQDDLSRPWFEPVVPSENRTPDSGPPTTRIAGSLPLDEVIAQPPAAPAPAPFPAPGTTPNPPAAAAAPAPVPAAVPGEPVAHPPLAPLPTPEQVEVTQPYIPAIRDEQPEFAKHLNPAPSAAPTGPQPVVPATPAAPVRKRSLMRRVVRRIIGPDLLRKDPPRKKR